VLYPLFVSPFLLEISIKFPHSGETVILVSILFPNFGISTIDATPKQM
jgi:hypothetical protein